MRVFLEEKQGEKLVREDSHTMSIHTILMHCVDVLLAPWRKTLNGRKDSIVRVVKGLSICLVNQPGLTWNWRNTEQMFLIEKILEKREEKFLFGWKRAPIFCSAFSSRGYIFCCLFSRVFFVGSWGCFFFVSPYSVKIYTFSECLFKVNTLFSTPNTKTKLLLMLWCMLWYIVSQPKLMLWKNSCISRRTNFPFEMKGTFRLQPKPLKRRSPKRPKISFLFERKLFKTCTFCITVKRVKNVRGQFAAFLAFKATDQRHIINLLFETLQFWFLWNFCEINQFWATAPMDLKNQVRAQKNREKIIFQAQFWSVLINRSFWNFLWSLQFAWI